MYTTCLLNTRPFGVLGLIKNTYGQIKYLCHLPPEKQIQMKVSQSIIKRYYKGTSKQYFSTVWWEEIVKLTPYAVVVGPISKVENVKTWLWICFSSSFTSVF